MTDRKYGGAYGGYWLAPARESWLREADAKGFARDVFWYVWLAFRDPGLVWC